MPMEDFTFHCFDLTFKVEMVDAWGGSVGLSRADTLEIRIDRNAAEGMQKIALLHEFLHIVSYLFALNLPETQVSFLGVVLPRHWPLCFVPSEERITGCLRECEVSGQFELSTSSRSALAAALCALSTESPEVFNLMFSRRSANVDG